MQRTLQLLENRFSFSEQKTRIGLLSEKKVEETEEMGSKANRLEKFRTLHLPYRCKSLLFFAKLKGRIMEKQIRTKGFCNALQKKLEKENPELAAKISLDELHTIMDTSFKVMAELLKNGYRVILEGYFSFFTKPIKRKCSNLQDNDKETWWTLKRRIRIKPMENIKKMVETEITVEEYDQYKYKNNKKKSPAS